MQRANALRAERWLRGGALLVLGAAAYSICVLALADHWSRSARLEDRERAVRWLPESGALHKRLAEMREDPIAELQRAVTLEPANAKCWEQLGSRSEIAGDIGLAERGLLAAAERSRLYQPRYLLAQFYFRRGNAAEFERWWRAAVEVAPGEVTPLLDLEWRVNPDAAALAERGMTARSLIARQMVMFLVEHANAGAARKLAEHLAEMAGAEDMWALLGYTNQVLADTSVESATAVWNALCRRRVIPYAAGGPVTNANFAHAPLGAGFDWHFEPPAGAGLERLPGALRITFSGSQPETCVLVWQYVPLRKGAAVRLHHDAPSGRGVTWTFFVPGEGGWREWNGLGPSPADVARLVLMYRRPVGVPRLNETVTVSAVRLEVAP